MEAINSIRLTGRITEPPVLDHVLCGEAFYSMRVAASRLSGTEDVLPVTCSERLFELTGEPKLCDTVSITGQIRSYNRRSEMGAHLVIAVFARTLEIPDEPPRREENDAELSGFICKPVIYRLTPFMREISDILIAVPRRYGKCDHLPVIAWGRNARFAERLEVGSRILLTGRLQSRRYKKLLAEGPEERTAYEVSCSSIDLLE